MTAQDQIAAEDVPAHRPRPAVVIPVWKLDLNRYERISIDQHLSVLQQHDCYLLVPASLRKPIEEQLLPILGAPQTINFHVVDDRWLRSRESYNQLMLTLDFYEFYQYYSHLLIAQLDAYTFSDQLMSWCDAPFDYIGAPIYDCKSQPDSEPISMGSGGFSLRRIKAFIRALGLNPVIFHWADLGDQLKFYSIKGKAIKMVRYASCCISNGNRLRAETNSLARWAGVNEDICYAKYLPAVDPDFRVADYAQSVAFCIDGYVDRQLKILNGARPFGTHGWWTFGDDLEAWTPLIPQLQHNSPGIGSG